jgi:membrane-bound lytic murein transglycosylase D
MKLKILATTLLAILLSQGAFAQQRDATGEEDWLGAVNGWMRDNLDDRVLAVLDNVDHEKVAKLFAGMEKELANTNVVELARFKETARQALPLLQRYEETQPYAAWLQSRLDYLEAADDLKQEIKRSATPKSGSALGPKGSQAMQKEIWEKRLKQRPPPPLAKTYVPKLKQIFTAEKLPAELVWVAEVESSFDPKARSPAGAVGIFQLMPATAKSLDLSLFPRDERFQPEKNARASAKYFRRLYLRFGNWPLTLAAYNAGESRVDKLLKQKKAKSFDSIARYLPAETQMYVPRIEATIQEREGVGFVKMKLPRG